MLGIIRAMGKEVVMIKAQLTDVQMESRTAVNSYKGKLEGKEVVTVRSGIGKVNAAVCTQTLTDIYGVTGVMSAGITSSLEAETGIEDIVLSNDALQHSMDAAGFGYKPGQIPRVGTLAFKADEGLINLAGECCSRVNPDIHTFVGRMVTRDQFISDKEKKEWLTDTFGRYYTGIEGVAIAQACYLSSIPFFITGAISDKTDDGTSVGYPAFETKAIIHSVNLLTGIIRSLR